MSSSSVSLDKTNANAGADQDLDNLIFNEKKDGANATADDANTSATVDENGQPEGDDHDSDSDGKEKKAGSKFDRASIANVLPVDKLKNGASTATKCVLCFLRHFISHRCVC